MKQLLIERGLAFSINKEKVNSLKESLVVENSDSNTLILKKVPCTILEKKNLNGRVYSESELNKSLANSKSYIESRSALCQANDHPDDSYVKPTDASHLVVNAYIESVPGVGPVLFNDWEVLNTSKGKDLRALIESNCSLGTSIRGLGDLINERVVDYEYLGTDVVGNPSSGTFTKLFESVEVDLEVKPLTEGTNLNQITYTAEIYDAKQKKIWDQQGLSLQDAIDLAQDKAFEETHQGSEGFFALVRRDVDNKVVWSEDKLAIPYNNGDNTDYVDTQAYSENINSNINTSIKENKMSEILKEEEVAAVPTATKPDLNGTFEKGYTKADESKGTAGSVKQDAIGDAPSQEDIPKIEKDAKVANSVYGTNAVDVVNVASRESKITDIANKELLGLLKKHELDLTESNRKLTLVSGLLKKSFDKINVLESKTKEASSLKEDIENTKKSKEEALENLANDMLKEFKDIHTEVKKGLEESVASAKNDAAEIAKFSKLVEARLNASQLVNKQLIECTKSLMNNKKFNKYQSSSKRINNNFN